MERGHFVAATQCSESFSAHSEEAKNYYWTFRKEMLFTFFFLVFTMFTRIFLWEKSINSEIPRWLGGRSSRDIKTDAFRVSLISVYICFPTQLAFITTPLVEVFDSHGGFETKQTNSRRKKFLFAARKKISAVNVGREIVPSVEIALFIEIIIAACCSMYIARHSTHIELLSWNY